ncbi:MAG TPA: hypothetical protein VF598_10020, partial [Hymenobacter sp.]
MKFLYLLSNPNYARFDVSERAEGCLIASAKLSALLPCWLLILLLTSFVSVNVGATPIVADCDFQTYSQNTYSKPANGNNFGSYIQSRFSSAFPSGLTVGCSTGRTLKLTSASALNAFLPAADKTVQVLNASYVDPVKPTGNSKNNGPNTYSGEFAGEVVALALSMGFDAADPSFSSGTTPLKDAVVTSGTFSGKTVAFVLDQANLALGGCNSQYSIAQLNTTVKAINDSYDQGKAGNLLTCPVASICNIALPVLTTPLVTYCQGAVANPLSNSVTLLTGALFRLYTSPTGGTPLANDFRPSTATVGSTTYYVSQLLGLCESNRAPLTVVVDNGPAAPTVVTPLTYCVGTAANKLSSSVTPTSGALVKLYTSATGGTPLPDTFQPSTASLGSTTYYASQATGSCESTRTAIVVDVVGAPGAPVIVSSLAVDRNNIAAWGDSFTEANYDLYPKTLAQLSGYNVFPGGIGGETSVQIKDRMLADTGKRTWPVIIWAGRNDLNNPDQVKASIAAMVASLTHTNYLILSVFNGAGEGIGT